MMKICLACAICCVVGWDEGVAQVIRNKMFLVTLDHLSSMFIGWKPDIEKPHPGCLQLLEFEIAPGSTRNLLEFS